MFHSVSHWETLWSSASSFYLCIFLSLSHTQMYAPPSQSPCISDSSDGRSAETHDLFSHVASILHCLHFCFTSRCCICRQQGSKEKSSSAAHAHVLRVRQASTYAAAPSPFTPTSYWLTSKWTHALHPNYILLLLCRRPWAAHMYTHWGIYI